MELIKVTNDGALHFKLSDGRIGVSYSSGYVRVSTGNKPYTNLFGEIKYTNISFYQINKKTSYTFHDGYTSYKRELLPLQRDRLNHLMNFNNKNCK